MAELEIWDDTPCILGEGPLWHPLRGQLFWFDIVKHRLYTRENGKHRSWAFEEHVSAAGWVDETRLLIASETRLFTFDVDSGLRRDVHALEADNRVTRSNDGRADPWGGFWIGTMGKKAEPGAGAIYRYFKGELRTLYPGITAVGQDRELPFQASPDVAYDQLFGSAVSNSERAKLRYGLQSNLLDFMVDDIKTLNRALPSTEQEREA